MTDRRFDGRFAPGTFPGAQAFATEMRERGLDVVVTARVLGVPEVHMERIFEGSMPLPSPAGVAYRALAEALELLDSPLDLAVVYSWQRLDARVRDKS